MATHSVTSVEDLRKVLSNAFPDEDRRSQAEALLAKFGMESYHREVPRVRAAAVKLAQGDIGMLQQIIATACTDYRDVLAMAEYPRQFHTVGLKEKDPKKYEQLVEMDLNEHSEWVRKMTR